MKYLDLVKTIETASRQLLGRAAAAVNQSLVIRNWMVGAWLIEYEQQGKDRAKYGARLLDTLATDLRKREVKGLGDPRVLRDCRGFYRLYPQIRGSLTREFSGGLLGLLEIRQTVPANFTGKSDALSIRGTVSRKSPTPLSLRLLFQYSSIQLQELKT